MPAISYDKLQEYLTSLVPLREPVMQEMEEYAEKDHFPILGPASGYYCYQLARMIHAQSVFELGSGYGYSTAWFAKAVRENGGGVVHHTVWDEALSAMAKEYLQRLRLDDLVEFHNSEAVAALRQTEGVFDLIFNDINKEGYPDSLPVVKSKLRSGGLLIVDNVIWRGKILNSNDHEAATEAIRRFTRALTTDADWIVSLAPVRDGLIVAYKK